MSARRSTDRAEAEDDFVERGLSADAFDEMHAVELRLGDLQRERVERSRIRGEMPWPADDREDAVAEDDLEDDEDQVEEASRPENSHRLRMVKPRTVSHEALPTLVRTDAHLYPSDLMERLDRERPRTRGHCKDGPRPCPWVGCAHHLYLDVTVAGSIRLNFPDLEPHEMEVTCALDVADQGGVTLEVAGDHMNITRERIRQLGNKLFARLQSRLAEFRDDSPVERRRLPVVR